METADSLPVPSLSPVVQEVIPDSSLFQLLTDVSNSRRSARPAQADRSAPGRSQTHWLMDGNGGTEIISLSRRHRLCLGPPRRRAMPGGAERPSAPVLQLCRATGSG